MVERLREFSVSRWVLGISLGAVVLAGCGSDDVSQSEEVRDPRENITELDEGGVDLEVSYLPNGTRLTVMQSPNYNDPVFISQFCAGLDLMTVSEQNFFTDGLAGGIDVSVDHPACADGRLTKEDF